MRLLSVFLLVFAYCLVSKAHAVKVAILPSPGCEEAAAALTAEMSSQADLELVEREQINAIVREQHTQAVASNPEDLEKIGQILGADAVVFLERSRDKLSVQLLFVGPGLIADEQSYNWPVKDLPDWVKFLADRFGTSLAKLPAKSQTKTLVALLKLRSATASPAAQQEEREMTFLVNRALSHLPGVYPLERSRLREADWEKQISGRPDGYWTSAWLLDGTLVSNAGAAKFDGRLSSTSGNQHLPIQAEAQGIELLSKLVADEVAKKLQSQPAGPGTDPKIEAEQFQKAAEWSLRWEQYDPAERAAEASWILGNKTPSVAMLRAKAAAESASRKRRINATNAWTDGHTAEESLNDIIRVFSTLEESKPWIGITDPKEARKFIKEMVNILAKTSGVIQDYYFSPRERTPLEQESLRWVRGQIRAIIPHLVEIANLGFKGLKPHEFRNMQQLSPRNDIPELFVIYGKHASLWSDTPEESVEEFEKALSLAASLDPVMSGELRKSILIDRDRTYPIVAAWWPADRSQVFPLRDQLVKNMLQQGNDRALDALAVCLWRYYHLFGQVDTPVPPEKLRETMTLLMDKIWELRDPLVKGQINQEFWISLLGKVRNFATNDKQISFEGDYKDLQRRLLGYFLESKWHGPDMVYGMAVSELSFSPAERDQYLALIDSFRSADAKAPDFLKNIEKRIVENTRGVEQTPKESNIPLLSPTRVFQIEPGANDVNVTGFLVQGDRCYVAFARRLSAGVFEWDSIAGTEATYPIPTELAGISSLGAHFGVDGDFIYFMGKEMVCRFDKKKGSLDRVPLTLASTSAAVWTIDGTIYLTDPGTIIRLNRNTLAPEILASARRTPAQTILDDRKSFEVETVFADSKNRLWFSLSNELFRWDETKKDFERYPVLRPAQGQKIDRKFYMLWVGPTGADPHAADLLLIDKQRTGQLPVINKLPFDFRFLPNSTTGGSTVRAAACADDTIYALFDDNGEFFLKLVDDRSGQDLVVPIRIQEDRAGGQSFPDLAALKSGAMLIGRNGRLLYFSRKDLEAFASSQK